MESYRANKLLFVTSVLSILILGIGGTLSYFNVSNQSKYDAVAVEAEKIKLALDIIPLYTNHKLIPTNDEDVLDMTAYNSKCVDIYGHGACLAYDIEVSNFNSEQDMIGNISFEVEGIENLSYIVLDENKEIYVNKTSVSNGITERLSLGENFVLGDATESKPSIKKFTIILWLTNLADIDQNDFDAGGNFHASVSYESVNGSKMTGTIFGQEENINGDSSVEGDNL